MEPPRHHPPKGKLAFKSIYSAKGNLALIKVKDFIIAEEIISKAEAASKGQVSLSDIVVAYKKVMKEYGVDSQTENHYYSLMIKLSLNQKGNTWR